jgi:predicted permease
MNWPEHAWRDLRHALRTIRRMPGFAAVVIVSLAIGIGVNTAIFSWIQAVVFQPLPGVRDVGSFLLIEPRSDTGSYPGASWLEYRDLQERLPSLRDVLAFRMAPMNVGEPDQSERMYALLVSANYFSALGLRPALGRFISPEEASHPGGDPVVVISHDLWQTRFGGGAGALGQTLRVNDRLLTIVGVAPARFQGTVIGLQFDLWMPATLAPALFTGSRELDGRSVRGYSVMGRLQPGATRAQAQAEFSQVMNQLAHDFPATNQKIHGEMLRIWDSPRGPQRFLVRALTTLQGVMLLLLLAVCGNTANLVLARASARQREIAVRLAIGAGPWRIVNLLLTENLLLAFLGVALGIPIAAWGTNVLRAVQFTGAFPIKFQTGVDGMALAFAALLGLSCGLIFGLAPAVQLARVNPLLSVRAGSSTPARSRLRNAFMSTQVALALVVLVAAGLFLRSFRETRDADPGFRREGVLLAAYDLSGRNADAASSLDFARRLLDRLRALPSVESAAIAASVPLDIHGLPLRSFTLEGRAHSDAAPDQALTNVVTPGYFRTMGIPLRTGMDFADLKDATLAPQAIVNEEFVRRYIGAAEPIGRHIQLGTRSYAIAGVARNSLYESFGEPTTPAIYFSYRDRPAPAGEIHVLTRPRAEVGLAPEVRRAVREIDPGLPIYDVRTLADHVEKNLLFRRIPARMFVVLGPLVLVLAAIGIYAVVSYAVSHRTIEIGVRLALGATPGRVIAQIVGESLRVIGLGALAGWLLGAVIALNFTCTGALDLPVFLGVPIILLAIATFSCWMPARRAAQVDPMVALRHE